MRSRLRYARLAAVLLAVLGLSAFGAVATLLWTDWGHRRVCRLINGAVSSQIKGVLRVAHIEALSLSQLTARGVQIIAPSGVPAIAADRAVIDFSLAKMWAGEYGWSHADVSNCVVRVTEDGSHDTNMEQTFAKRKSSDDEPEPEKPKDKNDKSGEIDMAGMVTKGCTLLIHGGSLPDLKLTNLEGIMRVHVLSNGDTELSFNRYQGAIEKGLPMGELQFHDVRGDVTTAGKRLLQFSGEGTSKRTPIDFELRVFKQPEKHEKKVMIDAVFPDPTVGSLSTIWVALWSKLCPTVEIDVHYGKKKAEKLEKLEKKAER